MKEKIEPIMTFTRNLELLISMVRKFLQTIGMLKKLYLQNFQIEFKGQINP